MTARGTPDQRTEPSIKEDHHGSAPERQESHRDRRQPRDLSLPDAGIHAPVIAFLASERASYLTGVAINIDGGTAAVV